MNHCFGFSSEPGCVQEESPERRTSRDQFEKRRGGFVGTASSSSHYRNDSSSIGLSDRWNQCWNDCSCIGFIRTIRTMEVDADFGERKPNLNRVMMVVEWSTMS
ncbi:hypothetical protein TorRG33x02_288800 [Trema orientale]|uniref:Uncharacterized protein n=1 Tax=Trema orientale TaxID=63057 RepID=A0A2P5CEC6_TREOI|nr:hypothetical protein TorRG33x02_288800 [Trema orientale]